MAWKLSIDLSHPLVPSEGKLDPIDGLAIYQLLLERSSNKMVLQSEVFRYGSFSIQTLPFTMIYKISDSRHEPDGVIPS